MKVFTSISEWIQFRKTLVATIGFVPTMGGLHAGHFSLIKEAQKQNEMSVVSIYVNPTQFNNQSDLETYPMILEDDLAQLEKLNVDYVILPQYSEIYADHYTFKVIETEVSQSLEGAHRPGHFDGMLTIVLKLLNIVRPRHAYFGKKDFQQLALVQKMVEAFFLPVKIVGIDTIREDDGLAMSSRNKRLSKNAREKAVAFSQILRKSGSDLDLHKDLELAGFDVDYVQTKWNRRLGAVNLENVRLIDNVEL